MDISPTPEVEALFRQYEEYGQSSNYKAIARLYGNRLIAAGPKGIEFHRNNFITRWQFDKAMTSFYGKAGLTNMRIGHIAEDIISDQYSLVKVNWEATFSKSPAQPLAFTISYLLRKKRRRTEIIMLIAHEDEKKILEGYGIIK
jgi:hypothetical protein